MSKAIVWVGVLVALVGLGFGGHWYAGRYMSQRALTPKALGNATPAAAKLPFARVAVASGDRTLIGWWVKAAPQGTTPAPAVLFFHGNASTISDYVDLQKFFFRQGISSFVFDYTGFGGSGGTASLTNVVSDAASVSRVFADSAGKIARKVAMGSALGATVLLQAIDSVQGHVNGIVVEGVDASVKEAAVKSGRLPKLLAPVVADIANNVAAAANVRVPALFVHSKKDERAPIEGAERVMAAVPSKASLIKHWRPGHSAILASSKACDWAPVLAFIKSGALPPAKMDSTDVCAVEKAQADSAKARAAALAAEQAKANAKKPASRKAPSKPPLKAPSKSKPSAKAPASSTKAPAKKPR
ncbi:MAG TPA: alpha/beta hydrolase [Gemmatimonadaceae bacterium]